MAFFGCICGYAASPISWVFSWRLQPFLRGHTFIQLRGPDLSPLSATRLSRAEPRAFSRSEFHSLLCSGMRVASSIESRNVIHFQTAVFSRIWLAGQRQVTGVTEVVSASMLARRWLPLRSARSPHDRTQHSPD